MIQDTDHSLGAFVVRVSKTRTRRRPGAQAVVRDWVTYAVPQIDQNNPEKTKADDIHVIFAIPQIEFQLDTIQNQELRLPAFPEPQKVSWGQRRGKNKGLFRLNVYSQQNFAKN